MKILQLCCFTNLWSDNHQVESWDLKLGRNIFEMSSDYGRNFDLIVSAPPCDQFTKANSYKWIKNPSNYIAIARKCLIISFYSGANWIFENPPGRIESFIPELTAYRKITWSAINSNKEYVLYSNLLMLKNYNQRYGKGTSTSNLTKRQREMWPPELVNFFESVIYSYK